LDNTGSLRILPLVYKKRLVYELLLSPLLASCNCASVIGLASWLVGYGTIRRGGCTSGHGVCGC
jgi:hypothetical protein